MSLRMEQDPIRLGGGLVLNFTEQHLEVEIKGIFRSRRRVILWDTITKIDTELECWHGTIYLTLQGGEVFHFECRRWTIQKAVSALYRLRGRNGPVRQAKLHPEKAKELKRHRKVALLDEGLFLRKPTGCCTCSSHIKFVPWASLISVKLTSNRRAVVARTTIQDNDLDMDGIPDDEQEDDGAQVKELPSAAAAFQKKGSVWKAPSTKPDERTAPTDTSTGAPAGPSKEQGAAAGNNEVVVGDEDSGEQGPAAGELQEELVEQKEVLGVIHIPGSRKLSQALYDEMVHMVSDGAPTDAYDTFSTKTKVNVCLGRSGLHIDRRSGCFGGVEKNYMPWRSLVSVSWTPGGCVSKSLLTVHDVTGDEVKVKGASAENFEGARKALCEATREVVVKEDVKLSQVRSGRHQAGGADAGLELSKDGVLLNRRRGFCKKKGRSFAPWARIDGMELRLNCLGVGGKTSIVTEGGDRLRIARRSCATAPLWQILEDVRALKFGGAKDHSRATFNTRSDPRFTSKVDEQRITIASRRGLREWDLERVLSCQAICRRGPLGSRMVLKLVFVEGRGQQEVLETLFLNAQDSREGKPMSVFTLAALINSLAAERRCQTQSSHTEAAPSSARSDDARAAPQARDETLCSRTEAQVSSEVPDSFTVSLTQEEVSSSVSSYVGMKTTFRRDETSGLNALHVDEVNEGPVERWNERNPDKQVMRGHFITEVNGHKNTLLDMLTALQRKDQIDLVVRRTWP